MELIGRTTCENDERSEDIASDPARDRPLDVGGESIEGVVRSPMLLWTVEARGFDASDISDTFCDWASGS